MEFVKLEDWQPPQTRATEEIKTKTVAMLERIKADGDAAIEAYSLQFDGFSPQEISLKPWQDYDLDDCLRKHLPIAAARIEKFARMQRDMYRDLSYSDAYGSYGQRVIPLDSMAAYIPGGRFPLVSTALMTLIPARVAGVAERVAISPTDHPAVLAAMSLAGATRFIRMGGAQAIAAVALGSRWQAAVDMVVGPGNAYVNAAKSILQDRIKIDTLAGPSEILVLCDESANPEWIALDVLAQAEHDPMAFSVLGSTSQDLLAQVAASVKAHSAKRPEKDTGVIQLVYCKDGDHLIQLADRMAAEHLHVCCSPEVLDPNQLSHYGSLFVGPRSAVAMGDYCSGPNHTLPTLANARRKGGLFAGDFLKVVTWQKINEQNYNELAETAIEMARVEDLEYHRLSLEIRRD